MNTGAAHSLPRGKILKRLMGWKRRRCVRSILSRPCRGWQREGRHPAGLNGSRVRWMLATPS